MSLATFSTVLYISIMVSLIGTIYTARTNCRTNSEDRPWRSPCGDCRHAAPSHISTQLNRWIGTRDVSLSEEEEEQLLRDITYELNDSITMVNSLKTVIVAYFRGNIAHVNRLEHFPTISALIPTSPSPQDGSILLVIQHIYELFTRIAIFTHNMKKQLKAIPNPFEKLQLLQQLRILEHGGTWRGTQIIGGVYRILCAIYRVLPIVLTDLDSDIIPAELASMNSPAAERHNRDYYILHNMELLLVRVEDGLQSFLTL